MEIPSKTSMNQYKTFSGENHLEHESIKKREEFFHKVYSNIKG